MRFIILPYRKGERPEPFQVEQQAAGTVIRNGARTLRLGAHGYSCSRGVRQSVTAFAAEPVEELGLRVAGGPAELILEEKAGTLTLSGPAGRGRFACRTAGSWRRIAPGAIPARTGRLTMTVAGR